MSPLSYQRVGSVLFNSYAGNAAAQQRRLFRETLQRMMERLWTPLVAHAGQPDVALSQFVLNAGGLTGYPFTCQLNGIVDGISLMHSFTATLLSGFDVVRVSIDAENPATGSSCFQGHMTLAHTRNFLDWQPRATLADISEDSTKMPQLITVPFWSHAEVMLPAPTPIMTHLIFRSPIVEAITNEVNKSGDYSPKLKACLNIKDPRQRFFALHRLSMRT